MQFLALGLLLLLASPAADPPAVARPDGWTLERFHWEGAIGERHHLELINAYGDIRTREAGDDRVEVVANLQRHRDDPWEPRVEVHEGGAQLLVEVRYGDPEAAAEEGVDWAARRGRVDVTVLVPAGVSVRATTTDGLAEVKGIEGAVEVASNSGDVVISATGPVRASTGRGGISVLLRSTDWQGETSLETGTGDVSVWLPPDADARVSAATTGEISTDYSIEIRHEPETGRKHAVARLGAADREVRIRSVRGRVRILRSH